MDRVEKRQFDRTNAKNKKWFDNLPLDKKEFIGTLIAQESSRNDHLLTAIMDKCFMSAVDDNLDVDSEELKKIIDTSNAYILDYKIFLDKEGYEVGFDMIENLELRDKVTTKIKQYMGEGKDKAKGINLLKKQFGLPNAELSDLWTICRAERSNDKRAVKQLENINNKKVEFMEEVAMENENILNEESIVNKEIVPDIIETKDDNWANKKIECVVGIEPENKEIRQSKLKITCMTIEVAGEYGTYLKSPRGVAIEDRLYEDLTSVDEEEMSVRGVYEAEMISIEMKIQELNEKLETIREQGKKKLEGFTELREVFTL